MGVKRRIFDPFSEFSRRVWLLPDFSMNWHIRPFRVGYCYGIPSPLLRRHDLYQVSPHRTWQALSPAWLMAVTSPLRRN